MGGPEVSLVPAEAAPGVPPLPEAVQPATR